VKKPESLRVNYLNNRAQSLTELATFGSVLLVVLSFFIRMGMQYNHQQDTNMRAFRMAMADAIDVDTPGSSASVVLVEDKHIPDPQDVFGIGDISSATGSGVVTWGNTLEDKYEDFSDLPRMKYVINGDMPSPSPVDGYTTAGYINLNRGSPRWLYIKPFGQVFRQRIDWNRIRIYRPDPSADVQAMVLFAANQTDIIGAIARDIREPMFSIVKVLPEDGEHGDPVTGLMLLATIEGDINPEYLTYALNDDLYYDGNFDGREDVTDENVQGLLLDTDTEIQRADSLDLEERSGDPGYYKSTDNIITVMTTRHTIKTNPDKTQGPLLPAEIPIEDRLIIGAGGGETWQTDK